MLVCHVVLHKTGQEPGPVPSPTGKRLAMGRGGVVAVHGETPAPGASGLYLSVSARGEGTELSGEAGFTPSFAARTRDALAPPPLADEARVAGEAGAPRFSTCISCRVRVRPSRRLDKASMAVPSCDAWWSPTHCDCGESLWGGGVPCAEPLTQCKFASSAGLRAFLT